ncbi:MAG: tRNA pseudouridine(55) synthase TruB [Alphaproteobacteria bacterium]|nr:tRNA pseudouridine(55) synthase TruB [Alphaproteobacteria bacterium]
MGRRRRGRVVDGWIVIDKPAGMTSTQVVGAVRRLLDAAKAGHAGTLDPIATGVLPIALGEATKTIPHLADRPKAYWFRVRWGEQRTTDDREGAVVATSDHRPDAASIRAALPRFTGAITQVPPAFSAVKVDGERAYDLARANTPVVLTPRVVNVYRFELLGQPDADHADFAVDCGSGTYMRALARDLALALGTVAHIDGLRRLKVGPFTENAAITLDYLRGLGHSPPPIAPVQTVLDDIPALAVTGAEANRLRSGQAIALLRRADIDRLEGLEDGAELCVMAEGRAVALARRDGATVRPVRVLNPLLEGATDVDHR